MKKVLSWLVLPALLAVGCTKDNILDNSSGNNEGSSSTSLPAVTPDEDTEDDKIENTTFARTITIVFSDNGSATVTGDEKGIVRVNGNQVTADNSANDEAVRYELSGSTSNGFFKLYSSNRQALVLNGVSITNPNGAAINNQSKKRCYVVLSGQNSLSDGSSAAYATEGEEDMKAVLFSEGQLVFSGNGSLTVSAQNAQGKSGITSDDYVHLMEGPTLKVTAGSGAGHGVRGKDYVRIGGGVLEVTVKAAMKKGIGSDGYVLVEGGNTTLQVSGGVAYDSEDQEYTGSAGVKADNFFGMTGGTLTITNTGAGGKGIRAGNYAYYKTNGGLNDSYISGGKLTVSTSGSESNDVSAKGIKIGFKEGSGRSYVYGGNLVVSGGSTVVTCAKSEGLEAKGTLTVSGGELYVTSASDDAINCQGELNVTGGYVYGFSSGNDAIDANGNMVLSGGYIFGITTKGSPEVALDANTEGGYKLYIKSGATVVAYGGLESGYSAEQNVYSMSCSAGAWNALWDGSAFIAAFKAPANISTVAVSAPSLSQGYTGVSVGESLCNGIWAADGISGGTAVSLGTYTGNQGGGPGGGGFPGGGGGPGGGGFPGGH